jgi:hypothetical protein
VVAAFEDGDQAGRVISSNPVVRIACGPVVDVHG